MKTILWASSHMLYFCIIAIMFAAGALWYRLRWQKKCAAALVNLKQAYTAQLRNFSLIRKKMQIALMLIALAFLSLALMRPQGEDSQQVVEQHGREVLIALDISRSMLAQDVKPNRLEVAKNKIKRLVELLAPERVGLIIFSTQALVYCPMTDDIDAFMHFLATLDAGITSAGGTALNQALEKSLEAFQHAACKKNKILVLVTDGEDFAHNTHDALQQVQQAGIRIFTLGIGTPEGAPIALLDNQGKVIGHQKDAQGNVVISRLNEHMLKKLASNSGAVYIHLDPSNSGDITHLVQYLQKFEKELLGQKQHALAHEYYYIPASAALVILLLQWVL